ncbi:hypothetical protein [Methanopyrus sp.]
MTRVGVPDLSERSSRFLSIFACRSSSCAVLIGYARTSSLISPPYS